MIFIKSISKLPECFLFAGLSKDSQNEILCKITKEIKCYSAKEIIYSPNDFEKKIGIVISGECLIERVKSDGTHIPLNVAKSTDSFGIVAVLTETEEFPTQITAKKNTKILYVTKDELNKLIEQYPAVAKNVITFLSKKVVFLNSKIATFSSGTVEEKLASFILSEYTKTKKTELNLNLKKTAEGISAGRASLYRAISSLTERGIISQDNKKINILDLEGLERISK